MNSSRTGKVQKGMHDAEGAMGEAETAGEQANAAPQVIVVAGAPGSGKSTVCGILKGRMGWPLLELGRFREPHLDYGWTNASAAEEGMAFDTLCYAVRNYLRHGYRTVLVTDLTPERVQDIPLAFANCTYIIVSLVLSDDAELTRRVLDPNRDSGFRWVTATLEWNRALRESALLPNESRVDSTSQRPEETADAVLACIASPRTRASPHMDG